MDISKDVILLLQYLLPGFISAWVFYAFTSYPKPSQFERVVEALIFTIIIQAVLFSLKALLLYIGHFYTFGIWNEASQIIWSVCFATIFGFVLAYFANNDKLHRIFRYLKITRQTSYASEWFHAFKDNVTYVVLHLEDERRLFGWPLEWPSDPTSGHFLIANASWLKSEKEEIFLNNVENILVNAKDVKWVEFMKETWEDNHEQESTKPTTATTTTKKPSK
ncbi:MAG: DUF6338 family protein [Porphyromonadaceae bacterium]|nr:DUF6338 family protein [Porphyromonadaceae bacterium]